MRKYLVALSGGADSVCLLLKMIEEGRSVEAVHCNFHLRGDESDRDEAFVVSLCERLGVPLHRVHFDTKEYAALHKVSIELAARELRYRYFEQLRRDIGAEGIMVAHHRDDNVETVLMNLVRGTGIRGMAGIRPVNGHILRPLLDMSRQDIEDYLEKKGETYVTDSTNLEDDATRNKFRHHVIPLLQSLNPKASENIHTTSRHIAEAEKILSWAIQEARRSVLCVEPSSALIDVSSLLSFVSPSYLLNEICRDYGFTPSQSEDMLAAASSSRVGATFLSTSHIAAIAHSGGSLCIQIAKKTAPQKEYRIPEPGIYRLSDGISLRLEKINIAEGFRISKSPDVATIDINKVKFPLTLRPIRQGDRFTPFGMKGTKLVSDYLTDIKCSVIDRQRQMVIEDATGMIIWLVGRRTNEKSRIDSSSNAALTITISQI
ncbi:MAG: tRNA lysidine(34) synthetase TilS [Prevotella sp.]